MPLRKYNDNQINKYGVHYSLFSIDHLSTLTNLAEYKIKSKKFLFVAFIDFSKAYDRINRDLLWS